MTARVNAPGRSGSYFHAIHTSTRPAAISQDSNKSVSENGIGRAPGIGVVSAGRKMHLYRQFSPHNRSTPKPVPKIGTSAQKNGREGEPFCRSSQNVTPRLSSDERARATGRNPAQPCVLPINVLPEISSRIRFRKGIHMISKRIEVA